MSCEKGVALQPLSGSHWPLTDGDDTHFCSCKFVGVENDTGNSSQLAAVS
jgi:hypothetical protein